MAPAEDPDRGAGGSEPVQHLGHAPSPWAVEPPPGPQVQIIRPLLAMRLGVPIVIAGFAAIAAAAVLDGDRDPRLPIGLILFPIGAIVTAVAAIRERIEVTEDELRVVRLRATTRHPRADLVAVVRNERRQPAVLRFEAERPGIERPSPWRPGLDRFTTARIPLLQTSRSLSRALGVAHVDQDGNPMPDRWYRLRNSRGRIRWIPIVLVSAYGAAFLAAGIAWLLDG